MRDDSEKYTAYRSATDTAYSIVFNPGQDISLQFHKAPSRYKSHVVGVERFHYAICKLPISPGITSALSLGSGLTVRFENSGTIYGFHSMVLDCIFKPSNMLVFSYPNKIETVRLRNHARVKCMLPASVSSGAHYSFDGFLGDISQSGCRMIVVHEAMHRIHKLIMVGDTVDIRLPLDGLRTYSCKAVLKSFRKTPNALTMGFSFDFPHGTPRQIARFVTHMLTASSENNPPAAGMN